MVIESGFPLKPSTINVKIEKNKKKINAIASIIKLKRLYTLFIVCHINIPPSLTYEYPWEKFHNKKPTPDWMQTFMY